MKDGHGKIHFVQVEAGRLELLKRVCPDIASNHRRRVQYAIDAMLARCLDGFDPNRPYAVLGDHQTGARPEAEPLAETGDNGKGSL